MPCPDNNAMPRQQCHAQTMPCPDNNAVPRQQCRSQTTISSCWAQILSSKSTNESNWQVQILPVWPFWSMSCCCSLSFSSQRLHGVVELPVSACAPGPAPRAVGGIAVEVEVVACLTVSPTTLLPDFSSSVIWFRAVGRYRQSTDSVINVKCVQLFWFRGGTVAAPVLILHILTFEPLLMFTLCVICL